MSWNNFRGATEWALMVGLVFGAGAIAQAQEETKSGGNVVQIGRADKADPKSLAPEPGDPQPFVPEPSSANEDDQSRPVWPKYWIGLLGGPIPADNTLRAQLDLPENQGLVVANVVPKGPAAKAGLKQHDILLKGNGKELREMKDLVDLVMSEGAKKGQITLDVLRRNKHETVYLKPEDRPADAEMQPGEGGGGGVGFGYGQAGPMNPKDPFGGRPAMPRPNGPMQFNFRNFGPGVIVEPFTGLPNGVSISIQKQNDKPTHITVQRGDDKWDITGEDAEALKKLPDDLRPAVERMLHGGGGGMGGAMGGVGSFRMPNITPNMGPGMDGNQLREQLERMEKRLDEMQRRMHGPDNQPAEKPSDEHEEKK
jgi:PDZ domain